MQQRVAGMVALQELLLAKAEAVHQIFVAVSQSLKRH
jgi:hypothetical protein